MMSSSSSNSSIFYKFRSAANFSALNLPGSASVRLFDIKRAIVKNKKLDVGRVMDFELDIAEAETNRSFQDETEMVQRGTRLVVRRLPAANGNGLLRRLARENVTKVQQPSQVAPANFYTIDSRALDEEQFISSSGSDASDRSNVKRKVENNVKTEEDELSALQAALDAADGLTKQVPGNRPRQQSHNNNHRPQKRMKPNADPGLRVLERTTDKRVIGVPIGFRNLREAGGPITANLAGFKELKTRAGTVMTLETALALAGTIIPDYLQCAICQRLLEDALCLHWDEQGRSACDGCMRKALTKKFQCPITGIEGISPDDLHHNKPIQRAADHFREEVMARAANVTRESNEESSQTEATTETASPEVVEKTEKTNSDDIGSEFGGDVFAVELEAPSQQKNQVGSDGIRGEDTEGQSGVSAGGSPSLQFRHEARIVPSSQASNSQAQKNNRQQTTKVGGPPAGYRMGPAKYIEGAAGRRYDQRGLARDRNWQGRGYHPSWSMNVSRLLLV